MQCTTSSRFAMRRPVTQHKRQILNFARIMNIANRPLDQARHSFAPLVPNCLSLCVHNWHAGSGRQACSASQKHTCRLDPPGHRIWKGKLKNGIGNYTRTGSDGQDCQRCDKLSRRASDTPNTHSSPDNTCEYLRLAGQPRQ